MALKLELFLILFISFVVTCRGFSCYDCVYSTIEGSFEQGVNCSDPFDPGSAAGYLMACSTGICYKTVKRYTTSYNLIMRGCWNNTFACTESKTNTKTVYEELACCSLDTCNRGASRCYGYVSFILALFPIAFISW